MTEFFMIVLINFNGVTWLESIEQVKSLEACNNAASKNEGYREVRWEDKGLMVNATVHCQPMTRMEVPNRKDTLFIMK